MFASALFATLAQVLCFRFVPRQFFKFTRFLDFARFNSRRSELMSKRQAEDIDSGRAAKERPQHWWCYWCNTEHTGSAFVWSNVAWGYSCVPCFERLRAAEQAQQEQQRQEQQQQHQQGQEDTEMNTEQQQQQQGQEATGMNTET